MRHPYVGVTRARLLRCTVCRVDEEHFEAPEISAFIRAHQHGAELHCDNCDRLDCPTILGAICRPLPRPHRGDETSIGHMFFGNVAAPDCEAHKITAAGWRERARRWEQRARVAARYIATHP